MGHGILLDVFTGSLRGSSIKGAHLLCFREFEEERRVHGIPGLCWSQPVDSKSSIQKHLWVLPGPGGLPTTSPLSTQCYHWIELLVLTMIVDALQQQPSRKSAKEVSSLSDLEMTQHTWGLTEVR